jgi:hypothetical protein
MRASHRGADLQAQAAGRLPMRPARTLIGECLGRSRTWCFTITCVCRLRQSGLLSQRRIGRQWAPPDNVTFSELQRPRSVVRRGPTSDDNVTRKAGRCDLVSAGLAFHEAGLSSLTPRWRAPGQGMGPVFAVCAPRSALVLESASKRASSRRNGQPLGIRRRRPVGSITVNACRMIGGPAADCNAGCHSRRAN